MDGGNSLPTLEAEKQRMHNAHEKKEQKRKDSDSMGQQGTAGTAGTAWDSIVVMDYNFVDDEKPEKSVEIDPEIASTDSPNSSGSSFSGQTAQTVGVHPSNRGLATSCCSRVMGPFSKCCSRKSAARPALTSSTSRYDIETGRAKDKADRSKAEAPKGNKAQGQHHIDVPKTFDEMFQWNSAVMGLSGRKWMQEVLNSFTAMVEHISDTKRLQQECNIVSIRIAKTSGDNVSLSEFKSCMLAALRSLLPTTWDTNHELAWNWLWDNVETLLKKTMGKPLLWEQSLSTMLMSLSDEEHYNYRVGLYDRYFAAVPAGQDYFKQSNTRLLFIAESATNMSLQLLGEPWQMVDEISALGLRHVGYGIPTETWRQGQVMKAINNNSYSQLQNAMNSAPRGERFNWVLIVKADVGTQDISPLRWAIESGSLSAAKAIIEDLLTIRADRERYYYGVDALFLRHPDIVQIICSEAPMILETFLEGLVWRSRLTKDGLRRVNFYVKNLVIDSQGHFAGALAALVGLGDPKRISHPVVDLVSNRLWAGVVSRQFMVSKLWFIFSLVILMVSQTLLPEYRESFEVRVVTFICRILTYLLTLMVLLGQHSRDIVRAYLHHDTVRIFRRIPIPRYWTEFYHLVPWRNLEGVSMLVSVFVKGSSDFCASLPPRNLFFFSVFFVDNNMISRSHKFLMSIL
eukprot:Skav216477  [mRNA]  locus=scaffold1123:291572:299161:- [translate_table: standard]